jgi:hypothetical protein
MARESRPRTLRCTALPLVAIPGVLPTVYALLTAEVIRNNSPGTFPSFLTRATHIVSGRKNIFERERIFILIIQNYPSVEVGKI